MNEDAPRLYLITPQIADAGRFAATFEAAVDAGDVACVLLQLDIADPLGAKKVVGTLAPLAQRRGIACLVGDPRHAADADGVHVTSVGPALDAALAIMKPERIVGVGGLESRDEAMRAGEAGADYLMFGAPWEKRGFVEIRERVAWWAEIFNPACVAYADQLDEVAELARAGADFVALGPAAWNDPRGAAAAVTAADAALAQAREPAS